MISHNRSFQLGKIQLEKWITLLWITLKTSSNLLTSNLHSVRRAYKCLELLTKTLLVSFLFVFHSHSNKRTCRMIRKRITPICSVFDDSSFLSIFYIASASKSRSFVAWNCILMNPIQKPSSSLWSTKTINETAMSVKGHGSSPARFFKWEWVDNTNFVHF